MASYPIAPKRQHLITQHGVTRNDEYYWMRESENPEVIQYLQAENEYLEETLAHTKPLQEKLFQEMKSRIKETDSTVPEKSGDYFYYKRLEAEKQYPIHCRRKDSLDAPEEIILDHNQLAEGAEFCSISALSISPDGTKLAFSMDTEGDEIYTIHIKNLIDDSYYPEKIGNVYGSVYFSTGIEWGNDNQTLFYVTLGESQRADKVYRHQLGTDPSEDVLLLEEKDETFSLAVFKTRSQSYIMIYHYNTLSQEMHFIPADQPASQPQVLQSRRPGHEYFATHHGESFYIVTNKDAYNFRLMKTSANTPGEENWQEIIPHRENVLLDHIDLFEEYMILHERSLGLKRLRVSRIDHLNSFYYVSFPDPTYEVYGDNNPEFKTDLFRIRYSSLITPYSVVDIHLDSGEWELKKEDEVSEYNKTEYATEYIHASAADGKQVPMSICYKRDLKKSGQNPTLLYGYGAYGASSDASFNSALISLLDRGFVYAIGHVRGGSELGQGWYDDGRHLHKKNSFTDLIACAEHLIQEGFTSKEKLAITGSSAGGLLVGASMTMRPDLFKVVICKVPFLDVITSMSDPTIPLTTLEYDQWGNPDESKELYDYMMSYSPYDNIQPIEYPHLLLTTGFNDQRVAYWEPAKFAARLRATKQGSHLVLLQTNFSAGHAGASGRYDYLQENVLDFAFLIDKLT